jgi:hypothetical protein
MLSWKHGCEANAGLARVPCSRLTLIFRLNLNRNQRMRKMFHLLQTDASTWKLTIEHPFDTKPRIPYEALGFNVRARINVRTFTDRETCRRAIERLLKKGYEPVQRWEMGDTRKPDISPI